MRRHVTSALLTLLAILLLTTAASARSFAVGDGVDALWRGEWWSAKVIAVKDGRYKIHYPGWAASWDEWVDAKRLRAPDREQRLEVLWRGVWYRAYILESEGDRLKIRYNGWGARWDEWVGPERYRTLRSGTARGVVVGGKVEVLWKSSWWAATVLERKGDRFLIHYTGWGAEWDEWVGPDRIMPRADDV